MAVVTALHSSRYEERQNEKYKSTYFFYFSQNCWRRFTVKVSRVYRRSTQEEMKKNKKINLFLHPPFLTMINITQQRPERVTKEQGLPHRSISSVVIYDEILSLKKRPMKLHKTKSISDTCQSLKGGVSIEIKVLQTRKITTNKDDLHVHQNDIGKRQDAGNRKEWRRWMSSITMSKTVMKWEADVGDRSSNRWAVLLYRKRNAFIRRRQMASNQMLYTSS